jgi:hypothetical protein
MAIRKDVGYLLPEVIDPEAAVCIRVYVPDAPEYIAAFWGSYEFLTAWIAWEKDDAHRGKEAAAVWKPYFEQSREEYLCAGGSCGMIDVRQKPSEPCTLQKLEICNGSWVDFADLRLCAFGIDDMLYGEGESWRELDDILWQLKTWIELVDVWLTAGKSGTEIKYLMSKEIGYLKGLDTIIDNMEAMTEGQRETAIEALDWDGIRGDVYCDGHECWDGYGDFGQYYGWLTCMTDWIFDTLNATTNAIFDGLAVVDDWIFDALNLAPIARGGGGGGFGGDEPVCEWEHIWNVVNGWDGWEIDQPDCGVLIDGVWYSQYTSNYTQLIIDNALLDDATTITELQIQYYTTAHPFGQHRVRYWNGSTWADLFTYPYGTGEHDETWTGSQAVKRLQFDWESYGAEYPTHLSYLRVKGIGVDPWS